jgi:hypothetical protein
MRQPEKKVGFSHPFSKDLKLVYSRSFEMNQQQTYAGSSSYVGQMRDALMYDNFLSPFLTSLGLREVKSCDKTTIYTTINLQI